MARVEGLFQQWLDHDPWTAEQLEPKREPVPVVPWLAETHAFGLRAQRPVTLELPEGIKDIRLHADERLVTRALCNLLDNAAKSSPPGSTIGLKAFRLPGELGIQVSDAGIGIAATDLDRIFLKAVRLAPEGEVAVMGPACIWHGGYRSSTGGGSTSPD